MRKIILGLVAATAVVAPLAVSVGPASADVTNNKTTRDAQGYCIANHIHNGWDENSSFNGDHDGIGWIRSEQTGKAISGGAGNRADVRQCITEQGIWGPISNNG